MRRIPITVITYLVLLAATGFNTAAFSAEKMKKGFVLVTTTTKSGIEYYVRSKNNGFFSGRAFFNDDQAVWLLTLKPGHYSISDWYMVAVAKKWVSAKTKYEFDVVAGEITYIGYFISNYSRSKNNWGLNWMPEANPVIKDRSERDIAAFQKAYPSYASMKIENASIDGFEWKEKTESSVPITVVP